MATLTLRPSLKHGLTPHRFRNHSTRKAEGGPRAVFWSKGIKVWMALGLSLLGLASIVVPMMGDPTTRLLSYESLHYGSREVDHPSPWVAIPSLLMPIIATDEIDTSTTDETNDSLSGAQEDTSDFNAVVTMPPLEVVGSRGPKSR